MPDDVDLRVVKTERSIEGALRRLLRERPLEDITVKEIVREAEVSKPTFYLHYADKYELAQKVGRQVVDSLTDEMRRELDMVERGDGAEAVLASFAANVDRLVDGMRVMANVPREVFDIDGETDRKVRESFRMATEQFALAGAFDEDVVAAFFFAYHHYASKTANPLGFKDYLDQTSAVAEHIRQSFYE